MRSEEQRTNQQPVSKWSTNIFVELKCVPFRTTESGYGFVCGWVILT